MKEKIPTTNNQTPEKMNLPNSKPHNPRENRGAGSEASARPASTARPTLISQEQVWILRHSLGLASTGHGLQYRNYFCDAAGGCADMQALVAAGLMEAGHKINGGQDQYFFVTPAGIVAATENPDPVPKLSRSAQRYRDFLHADSGMKFGEWLKWRTKRIEEGRRP